MTIPLHHVEVERLLALAEAEKNRREELMPDEDSAPARRKYENHRNLFREADFRRQLQQ